MHSTGRIFFFEGTPLLLSALELGIMATAKQDAREGLQVTLTRGP